MAEKVRKPFYKRWWVWAIAIILIIGIATGGDDDQTATDDTVGDPPAEEGTQPEENANEDATDDAAEEDKAEEAVPEGERIESGMHVVGEDIKPGLYKSEGSVFYWARLAGFSGELNDIIANGNPQGNDIVEIQASDNAFETQGSGHWVKIDDNYHPEIKTSFDDGTYLVGKDIEPGTYKSEGGSMGYWARLSGFTGELDHIVANGNPEGSTIVEIKESDKGFQTFGNGTWTKVE
jgi:hypothetical protein